MRSIKRAYYRFCQIICTADLSTLRLTLAVTSLVWGALLLLSKTNLPTYQTLGSMHPYALEMWSALFMLYGVAALSSLLTQKTSSFYLIFDQVLGALLWTGSSTIIIVTFIKVNHAFPPPGLSAHLVLSICSWWILARSKDGN